MNAPPQASAGYIWHPSIFRHVPWMSFVCIVGFVLCCVGLGVVLAESDNKKVDSWPTSSHRVSVSVMLSLLVSIANVCLAGALGKAYEVAWWLKAIKGAELHRLQFDLGVQNAISYMFTRSISLDQFSIAAIVALAVSVMDGPIIQKASTIVVRTRDPVAANITASILNGYLPDDFSGYGVGPDMLTPLFSTISLAYNNRESISMPIDVCGDSNTTCTFDFPGLGFDVQCVDSTVAYDFDSLAAATGNNNITAFDVTMEYGAAENVDSFIAINITSTIKQDSACTGTMQKRACSLHLATVNYPLTVSNGIATLAAWDEARNDTIAWANIAQVDAYGVLYYGAMAAGGFQSMLGGVYYVLNELYAGSVLLRLAVMTTVPYIISTTGQSASNYITSDLSTYSNCSMTWSDPTADYVNTARELMLRSILTYASENPANTTSRQLSAQVTTVASTYASKYRYMAATLAVMALQMIIILFMLHGWRHVGRHVSLDAFEVARALGAPLLQGGSSNSDIDTSLKPIRRLKLRYGEVLREEGAELMQAGGAAQPPSPPYPPMQDTGSKESGYALTRPYEEPQQIHRLGLVEAHRAGDIQLGVLY